MSTWQWEQIDAGRSGSSGDLSKLFKNEGAKHPGALASGAPPTDATLLAREAIQNSWDAGIALAKSLETDGTEAPAFRLRFVYDSLAGDEKRRMVDALGLGQLAARAGATDERRKLGLAEADCLDHLGDDVPLTVLRLEEFGTTGMDGPWKGAASKLYLALVSVGFTVKAAGSGGSYGYGKAGLIRGSAIHSVIAHTCFRERTDDPGVTRRLIGMTYWGLHDRGGESFTGFARLGAEGPGPVKPLENDDADELAARIGLPLRDPSRLDELGSTFLLLDPIVNAADLCSAIERNWWPALEDRLIDVEIETADGQILIPRPKRDKVLQTFIRGFELATTAQDNQPDNETRKNLQTYTPRGSEAYQLGHIGLVADLSGWSYAQGSDSSEDDGAIDHQSLVALVRSPRMVVEYYQAGRGQPFVRGTFVAHEDIDDLLRQTEPKAHDAWLPKLEEEGIESDAPKIAKEVLKRTRDNVRAFKKQLKPPPPREQDIRLPLLDDLFRDILENTGSRNPPPPPADPRPISISLNQSVEEASDTTIRLRATVRFSLTDKFDGDTADCRLQFRCAFDEDGKIGDNLRLDIAALPTGFEIESVDEKAGTAVRGRLTAETIEFAVVSAPYDLDWSTQLIVLGEPLESAPPAASNESGPAGE